MITWSVIFVSLSLLFFKAVLGQSNCGIQVPQKGGKVQIYLKTFRWKTPLDTFNGTKVAILNGETVTFTCENGFINNDLPDGSCTFQCINGRFNKTFLYEDLFCKSSFHKDTKTFHIPSLQFGSSLLKCNGRNLEAYQVKAKKSNGNIKHLYTVCFDKNVMRTKFVFQPRRSENPTNRREPRRDVWGFDYFGKTAEDKLKLSGGYVSKIQKKRITKSFPNKYNKNNLYPYTFNRGHLAPYSDFIDPEDKKASCEYINVAPQWREFNGNSWSLVEREARELVQSDPINWEIYTGTYGHIPTTRGPLFVSPFFNKNGKFSKGFVPVPKLYWKLVYNLTNKNESRVFVGVNNPEFKSPGEITDSYMLCKPKRNLQGTFFQGSKCKGFIYECGLEEFLEKLSKDEGIVKVTG